MNLIYSELMHVDGQVERPPAGLASICAGIVVGTCVMARVLYFYRAPDSQLIGVVPDDAFYYMQLARHRAADGFWTFDGTSPSTGFHFLHGYLLVALNSLFGMTDWRQLFLFIGGGASLLIGLAAGLVSRSAETLFGRKSILLAVAPFLSPIALTQSTAMMESWLALFFSAATIHVLVRDENPSLREGAGLLVLGVLGSLSRTDYGMLPGVLFLTFWMSRPLLKNHLAKRSAYILAGAGLGVTLVLLQNLHISGHPFQASAQTKFYWSSVMGHSISEPVNMACSVALPFFETWSAPMKIVAFLSVVPLVAYSWRRFAPEERRRFYPALVMASGCCLTVLGYILFYRHDSQSLRIWYSANLIAPIGMTLAAVGFSLFRSRTVIPSVLAFGAYALMGAASLFAVPFPHQAGMMKAGLYLKQHQAPVTYASWNAGIISYFSGLRLVNIDGITNDEVLPYIQSNTLFDYIKSRNIRYLIDYEEMLTNRARRMRGGYLDRRMDQCVHALDAIDGDAPKWHESRVRVFEILPGCQ